MAVRAAGGRMFTSGLRSQAQGSLNCAGQLLSLKQASGVKIILTRLSDYTNEIVRFRVGFFEDRIQLLTSSDAPYPLFLMQTA